MIRSIPVLVVTLIAGSAYPWSDAGHAAISKIAYRHLTPNVRAKVDYLLKVGVESRYRTLRMSSYWADEFRSEHEETGPWHYINIMFRADGKQIKSTVSGENVSWAVTRFRKRLADGSLSDRQRAEAFRFLIHFVGDAHQPMHNVSRITDEHPDGDLGGNKFEIVPGKSLPSWNTNLHSLWDSGCGAFDIGVRAWERGAEAKIEALSIKIENAYPLALLKDEAKVLDPETWVQKGYRIAQEFAYNAPEGGTPDRYYVKTAQEICMKHAALAGYRLAAILNEALAD